MQAPAFGFKSASDRLGAWNFYFVAKLALFALGLLDFHLWENLAFAAGLFLLAAPRTRALRPFLGVPLAIALLYYDSRLPGLARVMSQASLVATFSASYLAELAGRFVSWKVIAVLVVAIAALAAVARFVRLDVFVVAAMVLMALFLAPSEAPIEGSVAAGATDASAKGAALGPDALLAEFFKTEHSRSVSFQKPPANSANFDVIFLHVCSLSWDDLQLSGLDQHPIFKSFDILLTRFNSVTTYSGPAAIRFLRAPCGQPTHAALYAAARPQCLLMSDLQEAGLEPQLAMNHDGHFDDFLAHVRAQGMQAAPVPLKGVEAPQSAFDGSRIYDDAAVLARWLEGRARSPAPRAALYYNTLSLHDGNRLRGGAPAKSLETYKPRLKTLLDQLHAFTEEIAASGRRAVVVLVPEHGAALRGDNTQIAGLREVPTPAITLVPVGIRVVGPEVQRNGDQVRIAGNTSFLAMSAIVSAMLAKPPFNPDGFRAADYTANLPLTPFVAQVEGATVLARDDGYLIRHEREGWKALR